MPHGSIPRTGSPPKDRIHLSAYRAQRMFGPVLMVLGLVIAIGAWFDSDYTPGRTTAVLNAGMVPFLCGMLLFTLGCNREQIVKLKRRIAELEVGKRE